MEKQASRQLKDLLAQAVETASDVIIITEATPLELPGPKIVYVNKSFEALTGYTREEVIGLNPRLLQGKDTSAKILAKIRRRLKKNKPVHETLINYTKSGKKYWLDISIVPLYNEANSITHFAAIERDVCKIKLMERKLKKLATLDSLTGILNRRHFFEMAQRGFELYLRNKKPFSILMIDIDDFKRINDRYGHVEGDNVLRWFGEYLKKTFRKSDLVGRYGGEEFIVFLSDASLDKAKEKALNLKNYLNDSQIHPAANITVHFTVSIGVTEMTADDGSLMELCQRTDKLLYKAKKNKKNCVMWV